MSRPQAYDPTEGYKFQILGRDPAFQRAYEHCDYAADRKERDYLIGEYRLAYGPGYEFRSILLPAKYWPARQPASN